ncbi:MAG: hypothetical protein AB1641_14505 [Thermodesulfobacteriota bacterium]
MDKPLHIDSGLIDKETARSVFAAKTGVEKTLTVAAVILFDFFIILLLIIYGVEINYFPNKSGIYPTVGYGYGFSVSHPLSAFFDFNADTEAALTRSRAVLYENDRELGPANIYHSRIGTIGRGTYSHWQDTVIFSASDNSDPRVNPYLYRVMFKATPHRWFIAGLVSVFLLITAFLVRLQPGRGALLISLINLVSIILWLLSGNAFLLWLMLVTGMIGLFTERSERAKPAVWLHSELLFLYLSFNSTRPLSIISLIIFGFIFLPLMLYSIRISTGRKLHWEEPKRLAAFFWERFINVTTSLLLVGRTVILASSAMILYDCIIILLLVTRGIEIDYYPIKNEIYPTAGYGYGFSASNPLAIFFDFNPDTETSLTRSRTVLYENENILGPSNVNHKYIETIGRGSYSHWQDTIIFSTGDNSDPRVNSYLYRVKFKATPHWWFTGGLASVFLLIVAFIGRLQPGQGALLISLINLAAIILWLLSGNAFLLWLMLVTGMIGLFTERSERAKPAVWLHSELLFLYISLNSAGLVSIISLVVFSFVLLPLMVYPVKMTRSNKLNDEELEPNTPLFPNRIIDIIASVLLTGGTVVIFLFGGAMYLLGPKINLILGHVLTWPDYINSGTLLGLGLASVVCSLALITVGKKIYNLKIEAVPHFVEVALSATIYLFVSFVLLEVSLQFLFLNRIDLNYLSLATAVRKKIGSYDGRSFTQFLEEHRRNTGKEIWPVFGPGLFIASKTDSTTSPGEETILPLGSIPYAETTAGNEGGRYEIFKLDRFGFNNPDGIWDESKIDIALIGDSFCFGDGAGPTNCTAHYIRQHFPKTINACLSGDGPLVQLAAIKEYISPYRPGFVLWYYAESNDLYQIQYEMASNILLKYLREVNFSQDLASKKDYVRTEFLERARIRYISWIKNEEMKHNQKAVGIPFFKSLQSYNILGFIFLKKRIVDLINSKLNPPKIETGRPNSYDEQDIFIYIDIVKNAKLTVEKWSGKLIFVYMPDAGAFLGQEYIHYPSAATKDRERIMREIDGLRIPIIDIKAELEARGNPIGFFSKYMIGGHLNPEGQKIAADLIIRTVKKMGRGQAVEQ